MDPSLCARLNELIGAHGSPVTERPLQNRPTLGTACRSATHRDEVLHVLRRAGWEASSPAGNLVYIRVDDVPDADGHQPREHAIRCKYSKLHQPHTTTNHTAICDAHAAQIDRASADYRRFGGQSA